MNSEGCVAQADISAGRISHSIRQHLRHTPRFLRYNPLRILRPPSASSGGMAEEGAIGHAEAEGEVLVRFVGRQLHPVVGKMQHVLFCPRLVLLECGNCRVVVRGFLSVFGALVGKQSVICVVIQTAQEDLQCRQVDGGLVIDNRAVDGSFAYRCSFRAPMCQLLIPVRRMEGQERGSCGAFLHR